MKILFLTYQGDIAGSTNSIFFLAKELAKKGHQVYVGCRKESLLFSMVEKSSAKPVPMVFNGRFDLKNIRHIRDLVKEFGIELINAQSSYDRYTAVFAKWLYRLNVCVVHTRRQPSRSLENIVHKFIYVKGTDSIVVVSGELKKMFIAQGYPENHIKVIYNGASFERYRDVSSNALSELRKKYELKETDTVIGCVSRMKKQEQLIAALQYVDPSYKVLFVGIPEGSLDLFTEKYGIKNEIIYAGTIDNVTVLDYYKLMNVQVLPSISDGFGMVLIEAMACGVPVIGTKFGGIPEVIEDGRSGLLFEDGNVLQLADCIKKVLTDEYLRCELIKNGKKRALEDFSIEKTAENYEHHFNTLIENRVKVPVCN
jgi:glycosyltransferase involved in cell wall biosynthesis